MEIQTANHQKKRSLRNLRSLSGWSLRIAIRRSNDLSFKPTTMPVANHWTYLIYSTSFFWYSEGAWMVYSRWWWIGAQYEGVEISSGYDEWTNSWSKTCHPGPLGRCSAIPLGFKEGIYHNAKIFRWSEIWVANSGGVMYQEVANHQAKA